MSYKLAVLNEYRFTQHLISEAATERLCVGQLLLHTHTGCCDDPTCCRTYWLVEGTVDGICPSARTDHISKLPIFELVYLS